MRLNSIKLSGFKSFAEPTHFQLPGQLVGVVGPNGCGKSNIMDAVRWVLGESKASELRGESMQDVIFNGSGQRKPAGRASVELVFSNDDGRAGGQWNRFSRDRRQARADARRHQQLLTSTTSRCAAATCRTCSSAPASARAPTRSSARARSRRIIESKPEELRLFLEEAAGVSKYKERRRETENAPEGHAREPDPRRGHPARAEREPRQARDAGRGRRPVPRAAAAGRAEAEPAVVPEAPRCRARGRAREGRGARGGQPRSRRASPSCAHAEAELEALRQAHYAAGDELHAAQGALAEAALEVSRLEERIRYVAEGRQRVAAAPRRADGADRAMDRAPGPGPRRARRRSTARPRWPTTHAAEHRARRSRTAGAALPDLEAALRAAQAAVNDAARRGRQRAAADPGARRRKPQHRRSSAASSRRGASASTPSEAARRARSRPPRRAAPALRGRRRGQGVPPMRSMHELGDEVAALDEARRAQPGARQRRDRPAGRARARASTRSARCRRRCRSKAS